MALWSGVSNYWHPSRTNRASKQNKSGIQKSWNLRVKKFQGDSGPTKNDWPCITLNLFWRPAKFRGALDNGKPNVFLHAFQPCVYCWPSMKMHENIRVTFSIEFLSQKLSQKTFFTKVGLLNWHCPMEKKLKVSDNFWHRKMKVRILQVWYLQ